MYETDNNLYGGMYQRINPILDTNDIFRLLKLYNFDAPLINTNNFTIEYSVFKKLLDDIKKINVILWEIEDKIRICEKKNDFGKDFIELARGVYINNDKRAKIKSEINKILGSNIKEIKQYVDY